VSAKPLGELADVEVRPSRIEGLGLFARHAFAAGDRIREITVVREVTPNAPLRPELGERADHCDFPDGKVVLIGYPDRHVNHSCDPNAWVRYGAEGCELVARRAIAGGEEITCDYQVNVTGGSRWRCRCGATRCRGEVVGDFFALSAALQAEYRPYLAGWFERQHRKRLSVPQ
jgi:SET domain-containing protein